MSHSLNKKQMKPTTKGANVAKFVSHLSLKKTLNTEIVIENRAIHPRNTTTIRLTKTNTIIPN